MAEKLNLMLKKVEDNFGKGENSGNQHFFLFLKSFNYLLFQGQENSELWGKWLLCDNKEEAKTTMFLHTGTNKYDLQSYIPSIPCLNLFNISSTFTQ